MQFDDQEEKNTESSTDDVSFLPEEELENPSLALKNLRNKLKDAEQKRDEYLKELQKAKADFINLRKRDEEDKQRLILFANTALLEDFIPVIDSIELAQKNHNKEESLSEWKKGVESIFTQLHSIFKRNGFVGVGEEGEVFDPRLHEAIGVVKTKEKERDGLVAQVFQTGYIFKDKVLRPAKVQVWEFEG